MPPSVLRNTYAALAVPGLDTSPLVYGLSPECCRAPLAGITEPSDTLAAASARSLVSVHEAHVPIGRRNALYTYTYFILVTCGLQWTYTPTGVLVGGVLMCRCSCAAGGEWWRDSTRKASAARNICKWGAAKLGAGK